jgi:hypothetical protein
LWRPDRWRPRRRTAKAIARLCWAQFLVAWIPFERWRHALGSDERGDGNVDLVEKAKAMAADIEWAAKRLPFSVKCLPRAIALSWALRKNGIGHAVVIAVRTTETRQSPDALHAWVEIQGQKVIGDLPGPWIETLRLDG